MKAVSGELSKTMLEIQILRRFRYEELFYRGKFQKAKLK